MKRSGKREKPRQQGNAYHHRFTPETVTPPVITPGETANSDAPVNDGVKDVPAPNPKKTKAATPDQRNNQNKPQGVNTVKPRAYPASAKPSKRNKQKQKHPSAPKDAQSNKKPAAAPAANQNQPEKPQLRADNTKTPKLKNKPGKLRFAGDNPVEQSGTPAKAKKKKPSGSKPASPGTKPVKDKKPPLTPAPSAKKPAKSKKLRFSDDEKAELKKEKKLTVLKAKAEKYNVKLDKAYEKLPTAVRSKKILVFDKKTGKAKKRLQFEREILPPDGRKPASSIGGIKDGADNITRMGAGKLHHKISEVEHENVGVEAAHSIEQAAEGAYRGGKRVTRAAFRYARNRPYRTVAKLEKKAVKANAKYSKFSSRAAIKDKPKLKSNVFSRYIQKRKIKKQYAKAAREAKRAGKTAKKTGEMALKAVKVIASAISKHPVAATIIIIAVLLVFFIASLLSALGGLGGSSFPAFIASTYLAEDADVNQAAVAYSEWETDLRLEILNAQTNNPGYDEYRFNTGSIGHNPYDLLAFLTAVYGDFVYADIEAVLRQIFDEQYQLAFTPSVEVRYTLDAENNPVAYDWNVLTVTLTSRPFSDVVFPRLAGEQVNHYGMLLMSGGNRQYTSSPFDFNWLPNVTSHFGYRVHPITGARDYHMGIDIAVPIGTDILAAQDGTVTFAGVSGGYGYVVVIEDGNGLVTKYAHCSSILVSVGTEVKAGDVIAKSGDSGDSTGPHLHFEVIRNGEYLNPLFFTMTSTR
jgi:murein DD-endopeptidase MepM/ murein hydrolase activator NlpD